MVCWDRLPQQETFWGCLSIKSGAIIIAVFNGILSVLFLIDFFNTYDIRTLWVLSKISGTILAIGCVFLLLGAIMNNATLILVYLCAQVIFTSLATVLLLWLSYICLTRAAPGHTLTGVLRILLAIALIFGCRSNSIIANSLRMTILEDSALA